MDRVLSSMAICWEVPSEQRGCLGANNILFLSGDPTFCPNPRAMVETRMPHLSLNFCRSSCQCVDPALSAKLPEVTKPCQDHQPAQPEHQSTHQQGRVLLRNGQRKWCPDCLRFVVLMVVVEGPRPICLRIFFLFVVFLVVAHVAYVVVGDRVEHARRWAALQEL